MCKVTHIKKVFSFHRNGKILTRPFLQLDSKWKRSLLEDDSSLLLQLAQLKGKWKCYLFPLWSKHHVICIHILLPPRSVPQMKTGPNTLVKLALQNENASREAALSLVTCHAVWTPAFSLGVFVAGEICKNLLSFSLRHSLAEFFIPAHIYFFVLSHRLDRVLSKCTDTNCSTTWVWRPKHSVSNVVLWSADLVEILKSWEIYFRYVRRFLKRPCNWEGLLIS